MKAFLNRADIYISNTCNLKCENCQSYSNHKHKGHYYFADADWKSLADKIEIGVIAILGGEPTLNPRLGEWITSMAELWPKSTKWLISNGIHLKAQPNLHKVCAETGTNIQISLHSEKFRSIIADQILQAFGICEVIELKTYAKTEAIYKLILQSSKGVIIEVDNAQAFNYIPTAVNNHLPVLHDDYEQVHDACQMKQCTQIKNAEIYKCPIMTSIQTYLDQNNIEIPPLLREYKPLTVGNATQVTLDNLINNAIPQCSLCPIHDAERNSITSLLRKEVNKKSS